ncbi:amidohydrolase [Gloeobacter violaceus]|uniref:Glr0375 protein n=1 Tax=Gloeobacter violaceus (strain ATCC 29082 / PCC 7421) TaxID=251221 RepID=Q7NNN6_GLOVI|nr:amidohydrolase [Gloeobacter violaceus]BAC88316.1 glr0375 [Gloeobacter violaceus PCC 7421]
MPIWYAMAVLLLCLGALPARAAEVADLVLTNGRVWTGVPQQPWVEAMAVAKGRILKTGSREAIGKLTGRKTQIIDLGGRMAAPGFNDAHIHFLGGALDLAIVDLNGTTSLAQIQRRVAEYARAHPERAWIEGVGWQYSALPGGRLPTRADLDAIEAKRPVFLRSYDGHTVWVNSRALEIAKITPQTRAEGFGEIVRDPVSGEATGVLKESAVGLVRRHIPEPTREEQLVALRAGMKLAASLGITSIQNAGGSAESFALYEELLRRGELTVRTSVALSVGPQTTDAELTEFARIHERYKNHPMLRAGAAKLLIDGVIETHTAAMLTPYSDKPDTRGEPAYSAEVFNQLALRAHKAGLQLYTHAIGDRAVRIALDGYEYVKNIAQPADPRFRIEHIEVVAPQDIPRFARLGVIASMEPIHADPGTVEVWSRAVGPERTERAFAWADLAAGGARLVFSSDWPAAISLDPLRGLHSAVNRRTLEGTPPGGWVARQRVDLQRALRAYTAEGAYASFEENFKGRIAPGMAADLVVFSQDLFTIDPLQIGSTKVVLTVFDGKVIYRDAERFANGGEASRNPKERLLQSM